MSEKPTVTEQQYEWVQHMRGQGRQFYMWIDNNISDLPPITRNYLRDAANQFESASISASEALKRIEPQMDEVEDNNQGRGSVTPHGWSPPTS